MSQSSNENAKRVKEIRSRQKRKDDLTKYILIGAVAVLAVIAIVLAVKLAKGGSGGSTDASKAATTTTAAANSAEQTKDANDNASEAQTAPGEGESQSDALPAIGDVASAIKDASRLAAQYDYDAAIAKLEAVKAQDTSGAAAKAIEEYTAAKATLVQADVMQIPHIFFHSLIVDTKLAFNSGKDKVEDYNRAMTTVDEFNKIIQQMYDRGYVLVSLHQMAEFDEASGKMTPGKIMLPPGKKPFVLSIDDMSYYAYMMGDGFATKLVIGDDGRLTNEMEMKDGSFTYGSFDVVPLLNDFLDVHPDFSYRGAKGAIALTGYDGIFGYRTDQDYYLKEHLLSDQARWIDAHPNFDYNKDIEDAKVIAKAVRDDGWELATHSWGHRDMNTNTFEKFVVDMEKWINRVENLIGETDIVIFPFGTDIASVAPYTMDNQKYAWLQEHGFHYFCNVDANQPWVQLGDIFLRQGRINADGYMMYHHPEKLKAFYDVESVFDKARPTPVSSY